MKVSVGIITRNRQRLLSKCIDSILQNKLLPDEIIIVDNNSKDDTKKVIRNYKKVFPNIKFCTETKIGRPQARKKLFSVFEGEILATTDDDCVVDKYWIENIKLTFQKNPDILAIQGKAISVHQDRNVQSCLQEKQDCWFRRNSVGNRIYVLDTKNCALKKKAIKTIKIDEKLIHEDTDMAMQLLKRNIKILLNNKITVLHQEKKLSGLISQSFRTGRFSAQINNKWKNVREVGKKVYPKYSLLCRLLLRIPFKIGFFYENIVFKL